MFARLFAMTSISRESATWRDNPTRSAFCIGNSPFQSGQASPPEAGIDRIRCRELSQARSHQCIAPPVPTDKAT